MTASAAAKKAVVMGDDEIMEHEEQMSLASETCPHKVQVTIMCRALQNLDMLDKSDPYAKLYSKAEKA